MTAIDLAIRATAWSNKISVYIAGFRFRLYARYASVHSIQKNTQSTSLSSETQTTDSTRRPCRPHNPAVKNAAHCLLSPREAGHWSYQIARNYTEGYDHSHGTGLIPKSIPLLEDVIDFWTQELGLDRETLTAPAQARKVTAEKQPVKAG